jgi:hypothetical protein
MVYSAGRINTLCNKGEKASIGVMWRVFQNMVLGKGSEK